MVNYIRIIWNSTINSTSWNFSLLLCKYYVFCLNRCDAPKKFRAYSFFCVYCLYNFSLQCTSRHCIYSQIAADFTRRAGIWCELLQSINGRKISHLLLIIRGERYEVLGLILKGKRAPVRKQNSWLRDIQNWCAFQHAGIFFCWHFCQRANKNHRTNNECYYFTHKN